MHEVRDGTRTLRFEGDKLASASSWRQGSGRWIEFDLYKTKAGSYILARVGVSQVFHSSVCPLVSKYGLHEGHVTELSTTNIPCEVCRPDASDPIVFPEKFRYWTLVSEDPEAVLDALYKKDDYGARYLTNVAQRLLEEASSNDTEIDMAYNLEIIL